MEPFIQSVGRSFAENRTALPVFLGVLAAVLALVVVLLLAGVGRQALARRHRLTDLAAERGLGAKDLDLIRALAARVRAEPLALLGHLDLFERATAEALRAALPGHDVPDRIRALRHALGFDRLPPHAPLLTTRELAPGTAVALGDRSGQAFDVGETSFSVAVPGVVALAPGERADLTLLHAREARYELGCKVLSSRPGPYGTTHLILAHDEAPTRVQQREYVRVPARGAMTLHPASPWPSRAEPSRPIVADLLDLSGGGARVACREPLPVGLLASASFAVAGHRFEGLRAVVLSSVEGPDGRWQAHLEFSAPEAERERLAAAVTRLELGAQAQARHTA